MKEALKRGDDEGVARSLLDTANIDGQSVKGIAKRRAEAYNQVADTPITDVEQLDDGTIRYMKDGEEFFTYKAKKGKHDKSDVGSVSVPTTGL